MSLLRVARFDGEHAFLSNFYEAPFRWQGVHWLTSEHAFQAAKCTDWEDWNRVRCASTPGQAKRMGREARLRPDWERVKLDVMRDVLCHKFQRRFYLRQALLATAPGELVEGNTWGDRYWGVCGGRGLNWLGRLLMELRDQLTQEG